MKLRISEKNINLRLSFSDFSNLKKNRLLEHKISFSDDTILKIALKLDTKNSFQLKDNFFSFHLNENSFYEMEKVIEKRGDGICDWKENLQSGTLKIIIDVDLHSY